MTINSSTAIHDVVLFVRSILRTNLIDPINRSSNNNKFIFTAFPKTNTQYPLVTIQNTNFSSKSLGMQSNSQWVNISLEIQVYARDSKEADVLTDSIVNVLRTNQYSVTGTIDEGMYDFKVDSIVPIVEEIGVDNIIHRKVIKGDYSIIL